MTLNDSKSEAIYRDQVRSWLTENIPARGWFYSLETEFEKMQAALKWQRKKYGAGYACIAWPEEYGGQGHDPIQQIIYDQEEAAFEVPKGYLDVTFGMCLPTLLQVGSEEMKSRFIPPAQRGEEVWCQLFSEPGAGSDLGGLRTRARQIEGGWQVNGQKTWTSGAHWSQYGLLLVRTSVDVPKHKGLTMFWVDMQSPGIDIQPIRKISGKSQFNDVFFDNVEIPDSQRIGEVGDGWRMSLVTLMNERFAIGKMARAEYLYAAELMYELADLKRREGDRDSLFEDRLADWYIAFEGVRLTGLRTATALSRGQVPGPESSIGKVVTAAAAQDLAMEVLQAEGLYGLFTERAVAPCSAMFQELFLESPGSRVAGGTDEILLNVIAERVLGLPGDIRVDKDVPFSEIPVS